MRVLLSLSIFSLASYLFGKYNKALIRALIIINLKMVLREILSQKDLIKAQTFSIYELMEIVMSYKN